MGTDTFNGYQPSLDGPGSNLAAVTPNDSSDLTIHSRALWVGGAGNIKVDMVGIGTAITLSGIPAGTLLPIRVKRVYSTDTSATNIISIW